MGYNAHDVFKKIVAYYIRIFKKLNEFLVMI